MSDSTLPPNLVFFCADSLEARSALRLVIFSFLSSAAGLECKTLGNMRAQCVSHAFKPRRGMRHWAKPQLGSIPVSHPCELLVRKRLGFSLRIKKNIRWLRGMVRKESRIGSCRQECTNMQGTVHSHTVNQGLSHIALRVPSCVWESDFLQPS
jgi:hypothetical protein